MTRRSSGVADLFARTVIILISAGANVGVALYIYRLIWIGGAFPDLGLQVPWFDIGTRQIEMKQVASAAYPLVVFGFWLAFERSAAHSNPGYGWLWALDFWPSAFLCVWLAVTAFKLFVGDVRFSDPTNLWVYVVFFVSAVHVAYYNLVHWFPSNASEREQNREERVPAGTAGGEEPVRPSDKPVPVPASIRIEAQQGSTVILNTDGRYVTLERFPNGAGPRVVGGTGA
jgi:hypothetical protein